MSDSLNITGLDFDEIKANIITYLESQEQFQDYDFEASGISQLINVLAYNTHYMGYYTNMAANETFLDTAILRSSVVSRAKELGYTPQSYQASKTTMSITLVPDSGTPSFISIPKNTKFIGTSDGVTYNFRTRAAYNALSSDGYTAEIEVYEGTPLTYTYTVNTSNLEQKFIIPNKRADLDSVEVLVKNSIVDSTIRTFTRATNLTELDSESQVYFITEYGDGLYELKFGDDVISAALDNNNIISISYSQVTGPSSNGIASLTLASTITDATVDSYSTLEKTYSGTLIESTESIRFRAPRVYAAQRRAVTASDYEILIKEKYPNTQAIKVWGGEENDPPAYGQVFISIKQFNDFSLSNFAKESIKNIIKEFNLLTVTPNIIDPQTTFVEIDTTVKYDYNKLSVSFEDFEQGIKDLVLDYADKNLNDFSSYLRYSNLVSTIDGSADYITNNLTNFRLKNFVSTTTGVSYNYTTYFNNEIEPGTISSTKFKINQSGVEATVYHYFDDDEDGTIRIYKIVSDEKFYVDTNFGTVDYDTGKISLNSSYFLDIDEGLYFTASPVKNDIYPKRNQILTIIEDDISVTLEQD